MERTPLSTFSSTARFLDALARSLVAARWREDDLVARGALVLGKRPRWLRPIVRRLLVSFDDGPRPSAVRVAAFLKQDHKFLLALAEGEHKLSLLSLPPPLMWPVPGPPESWDVPPITTPRELSSFLGLDPADLDWLADLQGRTKQTPPGPLRHYRYAWRTKPSGSSRLIEAPKPRLKAVQRRLLNSVLARIPPHDAAHGFRPGRSIATFAAPHAGQRVVLKMDLNDFFPSVTSTRVVALFLTAGYPEDVARLLAGLCTNRVPREVWTAPNAPAQGPDAWRSRRLYTFSHLPQGAPTSPALATLAAYRLDARLAGLASSADVRYTRYADDLVFSGGVDLARALPRFVVQVGAVVLDEGFRVNPRKTRVMRRGTRQRIAGVVVNDRPNVPRAEFDHLKATLHNCLKSGPLGQNRDDHPDFRAHLTGRVAFVSMINPSRGAKLRAMLDAVAW